MVRFQVKKEVAVLETDQKQSGDICALLSDRQFQVISLSSFSEMDSYLEKHDCRVIILDLDTMTIDNRAVRDFRRKNPGIHIIAFSERQYHPELEEALRDYISACLSKPIDPDELFFWLRVILENDEESQV